jgi:hypothetical protein
MSGAGLNCHTIRGVVKGVIHAIIHDDFIICFIHFIYDLAMNFNVIHHLVSIRKFLWFGGLVIFPQCFTINAI